MDDYISRQMTIDALWKERQRLNAFMNECLEKGQSELRAGTKTERNRIEEDIEIIKDLPSVEVEPARRGQWVEDVAYYAEDGCPCIITRCNQCGEPNPVSEFCPHCGALMDGEQNVHSK